MYVRVQLAIRNMEATAATRSTLLTIGGMAESGRAEPTAPVIPAKPNVIIPSRSEIAQKVRTSESFFLTRMSLFLLPLRSSKLILFLGRSERTFTSARLTECRRVAAASDRMPCGVTTLRQPTSTRSFIDRFNCLMFLTNSFISTDDASDTLASKAFNIFSA